MKWLYAGQVPGINKIRYIGQTSSGAASRLISILFGCVHAGLQYMPCRLARLSVLTRVHLLIRRGASLLGLPAFCSCCLSCTGLLIAAPLSACTDWHSHAQVFGLFLGAGSLLHCGSSIEQSTGTRDTLHHLLSLLPFLTVSRRVSLACCCSLSLLCCRYLLGDRVPHIILVAR